MDSAELEEALKHDAAVSPEQKLAQRPLFAHEEPQVHLILTPWWWEKGPPAAQAAAVTVLLSTTDILELRAHKDGLFATVVTPRDADARVLSELQVRLAKRARLAGEAFQT